MAESSNIASTGIVLEALRKDNYENWSALVENYLVGQDLWHEIIVDADPNRENNRWWRKRNAKALHAIQLACGSQNMSKIRSFKNAREAWNHLKISFSDDVRAFPDIEQGHGGEFYSYLLLNHVKRGRWDEAKAFINKYPDSIFNITSSTGRTVLHSAVASGQEDIVMELVNMGNQRLLKMQDKKGYTALALAAKLTDNVDMAKRMLSKGGMELLTIETKAADDEDFSKGKGEIPVLIASASGHKEMTRYLFSQTPIDLLFDNGAHYCLLLLKRCISAEIFEIPALLLQHPRNMEIPLADKPKALQPLLHALARMPSSFQSGAKLNTWQQVIYNLTKPRAYIVLNDKIIEIVSHNLADDNPYSNSWADFIATHPLGRMIREISDFLNLEQLSLLGERVKHIVQTTIISHGSKKIYEMKKDHPLVLEILVCLKIRISGLNDASIHECSAYDTMLQAAKSGITEIINLMWYANPNLLWAMDKNRRGMFSHAILNRQEKVFQLIHEIGGRREMFTSSLDVFNNNLLHLAAELGPSSDLECRSNPALQMQRELQWYKAVEEIVPSKCKEAKNADGKKPHEVFTKNHENLMKSGENWAKDTARSFTIVGTLIITMMFSAAFTTVPSKNDKNTGKPIVLNKRAFTVFILADAISLITSSSSVLIFIGILTAGYAEMDFLRFLPLKLLFGLITLFISVSSMMIAFVAALFMKLNGFRGVRFAALSLAIIPVLVLIPTLLSRSLEIVKSTLLKPTLLTAKKKKKKSSA